MKKNLKNELRNFGFIISGSLIFGMAYALFIIPFHVVPGGVSGIAVVINYFSRVPVGLMSILLNIPLLILGIRKLGKSYGVKTVIGFALSFLTVDFFYEILGLKHFQATDKPILASIYGGLLLGAGLGLIFKGRASTGGSDIVGMILHKYFGIRIGMGILLVDSVIIFASGFLFGSMEAPLFGFLTLFVSVKTIDFILEGWNYARKAFIITTRPGEVSEMILNQLDRSGTLFSGRTLFKNQKRSVIMTVIAIRQFPILRQEVRRIDPEAFVIVSDVYEVLGRGFRERA